MLNRAGAAGRCALHHACKHDSVELVQALLDAGAEQLPTDADGRTPWELGLFGVAVPRLLVALSIISTYR